MKINPSIFLLALGLSLAACGKDEPRPEGGQANDLREAVQKPIGATNAAVNQSQETQKRLDAAMQQIDAGASGQTKEDQDDSQ